MGWASQAASASGCRRPTAACSKGTKIQLCVCPTASAFGGVGCTKPHRLPAEWSRQALRARLVDQHQVAWPVGALPGEEPAGRGTKGLAGEIRGSKPTHGCFRASPALAVEGHGWSKQVVKARRCSAGKPTPAPIFRFVVSGLVPNACGDLAAPARQPPTWHAQSPRASAAGSKRVECAQGARGRGPRDIGGKLYHDLGLAAAPAHRGCGKQR